MGETVSALLILAAGVVTWGGLYYLRRDTGRDIGREVEARAKVAIARWVVLGLFGVVTTVTGGAVVLKWGPEAVANATTISVGSGTPKWSVLSAPATPTIDAVVFAATEDSARLFGGAFSGDGADTHDSTQFQVDTIGSGAWSGAKFASSLGAVTTDTATGLQPGAVLKARVRYKGAGGGWSNWSDSVVVTMTYAMSGWMSFLPSGWTDTIIDDDFSTATSSKVTNNNNYSLGTWTYDLYSHGGIQGGRLTAHPDSTVRDSFTVAGAISPPYSEETTYVPGLGGVGPSLLTLPAPASGKDRFFISAMVMYEAASSPVGAPGAEDFDFNCTSVKFMDIFVDGGTLWRYHLNSNCAWGFSGSSGSDPTDPVTSCNFHGLVANNWNTYFPGDTATGISLPCRNKGLMAPVLGTWEEWWICMDLSGSTENITFGKDQYLGGIHTGVDLGTATELTGFHIPGTWGGGGSHSGTQSRWIDHLTIIAGSSGTCPTS